MTTLREASILITGAFGVLGTATAIEACNRGARVALVDHVPVVPPRLAGKCGPSAVFLPGVDLSYASAAAGAVALAHERLAGLDVLINIAGTFRWSPLSTEGLATWDELFTVNVKTALNASAAALPYLRKSAHGRIINIGANSALKAGNGMGPYAASKSAVHRLTESLAEELKGERVTVNAVLPSIIDTPANRREMPTADFATWVTPAALAEVILFLASDAASALTGALIPVMGRV